MVALSARWIKNALKAVVLAHSKRGQVIFTIKFLEAKRVSVDLKIKHTLLYNVPLQPAWMNQCI